ncbi:MAG: phage minor head protein [Candidatus Symbiobacter sp.]|nr:phage minor head protein [Candidatus Symbiobacter sp.]
MTDQDGYYYDLIPLPFNEAMAALQQRGILTPTKTWLDLWQHEHLSQFTVARSIGYDILGDVYAALVAAEKFGLPFEQFAEGLQPILVAKGWVGYDAEGKALGTPARVQTIYETNMAVAAARGHWQQISEARDEAPYLRYTAMMDGRTRASHRALNGIVRHIDDPFWDVYYPPCDYRCRCTVTAMSAKTAAEYGFTISEAPHKIEYIPWTNPRTGEMLEVPLGVNPAFAYNVGKNPPPPYNKSKPVMPDFGGD